MDDNELWKRGSLTKNDGSVFKMVLAADVYRRQLCVHNKRDERLVLTGEERSRWDRKGTC